ncbi:MAG TPA: zinc-ribbon domain-containing protein, partial [Hyphomicrobiaceae bacterium]|nr:zinc-ribbon domain-containing protein [Hyphomicrobiaceae bacterium]
MQNFNCTGCNARVDFENISCLACARALAFSPDMMSIVALDPNPKNPAERRLTAPPHAPVRYCGNWA